MMKIQDLVIAATPTDNVYIGKLSKDGKTFVGEKKNVTDLFHKALIDMYGGYEVVIESKGKRWKVKIEEIKE